MLLGDTTAKRLREFQAPLGRLVSASIRGLELSIVPTSNWAGMEAFADVSVI